MTWRKSSFCNGAASCVEMRTLPDGGVLLRDGKDSDGPALRFTPAEWRAFVSGVRAGEFDLGALQASAPDGAGEAPASTETGEGAVRLRE